MNRLHVSLLGIDFENPLMPAAGPLVDSLENLLEFNRSSIGALVTKTISVRGASVGKPCIYARRDMVYNTELWSEKPMEAWTDTILPELHRQRTKPLVISLGYTADEVSVVLPRLEAYADFFEVSTHYGKDDLGRLVSAITALTSKPLFIKLSPHQTDFLDFIQIALDHGASGVVAVNSVGPGLVVDLQTRSVTLGLAGGQSWISGPAIKPIALHRVAAIRSAFPDLPLIAAGGITEAADVLEFILAGADLVQMLSGALIHGRGLYDKIVADLPAVMDDYGIESIHALRHHGLSLSPKGPGGHPVIDHARCTLCKRCVAVCPEHALSYDSRILLDPERCVRCGLCESRCPVDAIHGVFHEDHLMRGENE